MSRADQRGYITYEDVVELMEVDGEDPLVIESVLDELDELGIELRTHEENSSHLVSSRLVDLSDLEPDEEENDPTIGDINSVSPDDPVGLYFRQMAQEPL